MKENLYNVRLPPFFAPPGIMFSFSVMLHSLCMNLYILRLTPSRLFIFFHSHSATKADVILDLIF